MLRRQWGMFERNLSFWLTYNADLHSGREDRVCGWNLDGLLRRQHVRLGYLRYRYGVRRSDRP
jgi:hypothetical protein